MTAESADYFDARVWGSILGENHDLGKGTPAWQAYLRRANNIVDEFDKFYDGHPIHAAVGAQWLYKYSAEAGKLLAYCIAGHHGGLPNWDGTATSSLEARLQEHYPEVVVPAPAPDFPSNLPLQFEPERLGFQFQFLCECFFPAW